MLGLRKNRRESFNEWYMQLPEKPIMVVQPKIDGIAIGLRYVDGKLTEAQTRKGRCAMELDRVCSQHSQAAQAQVFRHGRDPW